MTNYKAILLYYIKGNTTTQIATICLCSRPTVLKVIKRATELDLKLPISDKLSNRIYILCFILTGIGMRNTICQVGVNSIKICSNVVSRSIVHGRNNVA